MEHSKYLKNFTGLQADSFVGQLGTPYTRQWDLRLSNETESEYTVSFEANLGTTSQVVISIAGHYESIFARMMGFVLISAIPERGLLDALECLKDTWQFYNERDPHPNVQTLENKVTPPVAGKDNRTGLVLSK